MTYSFWPILIAGLCALGFGLLLVGSQNIHGHFTADSTEGIQKVHSHPTPRIGGLAIFFGLIVAFLLARPEPQSLIGPMLLASTPALIFGLAEDVTKRVGVKARFLATMACGLLAWLITGVALTSVDVPGFDWLLSFTLVSVVFTAFAAAGVANAINIVDGFNGLAAGTSSIILVALALIAANIGDVALARTCLYVALPVIGFTCVNWPMGKLFLGDGGAYLIGFSIAWLSILLIDRRSEVSAFSPLLVCAYPVTEVLFSIWRRKIRKSSPGAADRLHLHSLVQRRVTPMVVPHGSPLMRNSVTGALMWIPAGLPATAACFLYSNTPALVSAFLGFVLAYAYVYRRISRFRVFRILKRPPVPKRPPSSSTP